MFPALQLSCSPPALGEHRFSSSSGCQGELSLAVLGLPLTTSPAGDIAGGGGDAELLVPSSFPFVLPCRATVRTVVPSGCCSSTSKPRPGCLCCFYKTGGWTRGTGAAQQRDRSPGPLGNATLGKGSEGGPSAHTLCPPAAPTLSCCPPAP